jgi:hypothetical protein
MAGRMKLSNAIRPPAGLTKILPEPICTSIQTSARLG